MIKFLSENWGSLASIAGLLFSFLAFIFSKRASKAAQEGRDSARRQSLGEEMNSASRTAIEIVTYVGLGKGDVALLRVNELMNQSSYFVARWQSVLSKDSKDNLLTAREHLTVIHEVLTKAAMAELPPKDRGRLIQSCQRVSAILSAEYGTALRAVDERG